MIQGVVNRAYEAVIPLTLQGPAGHMREIEAVIDTGYSGFLTLPPALVSELELPYVTRDQAVLADGSEVTFDVYDATVMWDGQPRLVYALAAESTPLVGMRLLDSHSLYVEVEDRGRVIIERR